jgi:hypothetical protein
MRINVAVPEAHVSKRILDGVLEGVTRLNEALIEEGSVPTWDEALSRGVLWKPEPPGDEHFDHAGKVVARMAGDCDDLAPYAAATMRATGEDPQARAVVKKTGPKRWHAVVQHGDGSIYDPSKDAGMGRPHPGVLGGALPLMGELAGVNGVGAYVNLPQLALRPVTKGGRIATWQARADIPWNYQFGKGPNDAALVSLHRSPVASQAIVGACMGAVRLGEESEMVDDDVLDRVAAIGDYCDGVPYEELVSRYGADHAEAASVVGVKFFKMIGRGLKKVAMPIIKKAVSFIPGVGPVASTALDVAESGVKAAMRAKERAKQKRSRIVTPTGPTMPGFTITQNGRIYNCEARR